MRGTINSVNGVIADFLTPILSKILGEPTRESLIKIHQIISGNTASVASNLGGGWHIHLALTMTADEYLAQAGHVFVPLHKPGYYPPDMGNAQKQELGTERFRKTKDSSDAAPP